MKNRIISTLVTAVLTCLVTCNVSWAEDTATIRIGSGEWAPFMGRQLDQGGPANHVVEELFKALGVRTEFIFQPWPNNYHMAKENKVDVISCSWKTAERETFLLYGEPLLSGRVVFVKRKGDPWTFKGMASLNGKKVATLPAYGYGDQFMQASNFSREETTDLASALQKLAAGQVDLAIDDELVVHHYLSRVTPGLAGKLEIDTRPVLKFPCYLVVSKSAPNARDLLDKISGQLRKMKADGSYNNILRSDGLIK